MNRKDQKLIAKAYTTVTESIATEPYQEPERDPQKTPVDLEVSLDMLKQAYENQNDDEFLAELMKTLLANNKSRYDYMMKITKGMKKDPLKSSGHRLDRGDNSGWTGVRSY
jgi:hypothetical protein